MLKEIYYSLIYFLKLTTQTELLWTILPLAITTLIMIFYFEKYKGECPGYNTYVSNSMVLIFISMILFRFIYSIDGAGTINYVTYLSKTVFTAFILFLGIALLFMNFEHFLPDKIAIYASSPLTLNLIAYIAILYVNAGFVSTFTAKLSPSPVFDQTSIAIALVLLFVILLLLLNLIKIPVKKMFVKMKKMKEQEKVEELLKDKKEIDKQKKDIKKLEKKVTKEKLKVLDKQKKEVIKLKKLVKKRT